MSELLDRFCKYVKIESTAVEDAGRYPSSDGQLELGRLLAEELRALKLRDVSQSEHGIVTATIPGNRKDAPVIAWVAHVDTSPEFTAANVKPVIHRDYDGKDIVLPADMNRVIRIADTPDLAALKGKTIITTDGTTLLGADDKAGVAVIMTAAAQLMATDDLPRGDIRVCFTCDEEIGHGVDHVDIAQLGAVCAYTLDGEGQGGLENETFSADLATVTVRGINTHPGYAKDQMVNALRVAGDFLNRMPADRLAPERTEKREGFIHPYIIEGGVPEVTMRILLRDFDTSKLEAQRSVLKKIAAEIESAHAGATVNVEIREQYRNMAEGLNREPRAVELAVAAYRAAGIEPAMASIRGGTDGSALTARGLPTPNLSTGMHNFHSPLEWACLEEMETAVRVLIELAHEWSNASK